MDQMGDNSFSFQRLLYGDDWQRWDPYLTIDVNAIPQHPIFESNHGNDWHLRDTYQVVDANGNAISQHSMFDINHGNDWHPWDTYPTVDANVMSQHPMFEINHGNEWHPWDTYSAVEANTMSPFQTFEMNLYGSTLSQEEYIDLYPDTFSYEGLLNLTEYIGDVNTGLSIEVMDENLKRRKYESCNDENEMCVICQENLKNNEVASKLGCGHDFHFGCIKEWLVVKNKCPLCNQKVV